MATTSRWLAAKREVLSIIWQLEIFGSFSLCGSDTWMRSTCSADMFCITICCHLLSLPFSGTLRSKPSYLAPSYIQCNNVLLTVAINLLQVVAILLN